MKHLFSIYVYILIFSSFLVPLTASNVSAQVPSDISPAAETSRANAWCETNQVKDPKTGACIKAFTPLVGIPYIDTTDADVSLAKYVNALYIASISIAAFLAVVKIIFAGVKYMLSDVVTDKGAAKQDIRGALIGLLIVVGAVLILNTINPQLKGLQALEGTGVGIELDDGKNTPTILEIGDSVRTCPLSKTITECDRWCRSEVGGIPIGSSYEINSEVARGITRDSGRPNCRIRQNTNTTISDIIITDTSTSTPTEDSFSFTINPNRDYTYEELNTFNKLAGEAIERGALISYQAGVSKMLSESYRPTCEDRRDGIFVYIVDNTPGASSGTVFCLPK